MAADLPITEHLVIPGDELTVSATRSSGPGGQNVNKVATRIELRFDLAGSEALSDGVKARLRERHAGRLDAEGRLILTSQATRNRLRNLTDARRRLAELIRDALTPPKPRKATRPSRAAKRRRLDAKRRHAEKKRARQRPES